VSEIAEKCVRVLAVDDEKAVLDVYGDVLPRGPIEEKRGAIDASSFEGDGFAFDLVTCSQAREAVELVRHAVEENRPFAVALLDIRLPPGPDGIWVAERIRAADPHIEIVIVTGFSDIDPNDIARRVPPVDKLLYLQKPFLPQEIRHFASALGAKWLAANELRRVQNELEALIETRTAELAETSEHLKADMVERARAEEDRKRLATAIEQAAEIVIITDTDGAIQYVNPAFERITGYTREEVLGQNPRLLKSGKHATAFYRMLWETLTNGETWTGRFHNRKKDGTLYEEEATISPVRDAEGRTVNYVAVKRDITHEARLEAQLRQSQKMEALGTLAGGIAHDFNNLLQVVLGYTDMAMAEAPKDSELFASLNEILTAGSRATDLVNQILTFSRQTEQERKPLRLQPVIKEALKLLRHSLPATIEIRQRVDAACSPVLADPTQVHQVIMNLCANAYHAMREHGGVLEVTLEATDVTADLAAEMPDMTPCACARLTVRDTGCGMADATRARIFEPYFTTKEAGEGTGLGLSTVHGIVKSHDGGITVQSEPGKGTTFAIYLPVYAGAARTVRTEAVTRALPRGAERILLVDDEEQVLEFERKLLERLGYNVKARTSSIEALEAFRAEPDGVDLIIADQTMPNLTGANLAKEILRVRPDMPIILCTGFSEIVPEEHAKAIGIREYVRKPIVARDVADAVRRVLDNVPRADS